MSFGKTNASPAVLEASTWLAEINDGGLRPERQPVFDAWLNAAPGHRLAFEEVEALWRDLNWAEALNAAAFTPGLMDAAEEATPLRPRPVQRPEAARPRRASALWLAAAACLAMAIFVAPWLGRIVADFTVSEERLATAVGELRQSTLADGSRVALGGRTTLRVRMGGTRRALLLEDGDAYFDVARAPDRPFVVYAGGVTATAVGTAFEINQGRHRTFVSVTHGRVAVMDRSTKETRLIGPGQRARLSRAGLVVDTFDVSTAARWRERRLSFSDAPLAQVVEALDRYHPGGVTLADPELGRLSVSAAFRLDQIDVALGGLAAGQGLEARRTETGGFVLARSPKMG